MGDFENSIVELYDNCPGRHQIKAIAGMYNMSVDEVETILTRAGKNIPNKPGRPKLSTKAAEPESCDDAEPGDETKVIAEESTREIPEAVRECIIIRMSELRSYIAKAEAEYKTLSDFIQ